MVDRRCELECVSSAIRNPKLRKRTVDISKVCHLKTKGHKVENPGKGISSDFYQILEMGVCFLDNMSKGYNFLVFY